MAYDGTDNGDAPRNIHRDDDGRVLYVVDAQSEGTGDGVAYTYAGDAGTSAGAVGYVLDQGMPNVRNAVGTNVPTLGISSYDEIGRRDPSPSGDVYDDSFSALFIAYDAAEQGDAYRPAATGAPAGVAAPSSVTSDPDMRVAAATSPYSETLGIGGASPVSSAVGDARSPARPSRPVRQGLADDPDLDAMSALMDAIDQAEEADAPRLDVDMRDTPPERPNQMREVQRDVTVSPVIYGDAYAWQGASGVAVAVNELASGDLETEAALAALRNRRAQARRRNGAYAFVGVGMCMVILLALFVNYLLGLDEALAATAGGMASVLREDFAFTVYGEGTLEATSTVAVTPSVEGSVGQVFVSEGDLVEKGNILFTISNESLMEAVEAARGRLNEANAALTQANAAVVAAYNAYNSALDAYQLDPTSAFDESSLLSAITAAEVARDRALTEANEARDALEAANDRAAARDVTAPASGAVVGIQVDRGDAIVPLDEGASVEEAPMQVADVSQLRVTVTLSAEDAGQVKVGQFAKVSLVALPEASSQAVVESVERQGGRSASDASYVVSLLIDAPDDRLRPGAETTVAIETAVASDALVVPLSSVREEGDDEVVWVVTDESTGLSEKRLVSIGGTDSRMGTAMVVDGLDEGDMVGLP